MSVASSSPQSSASRFLRVSHGEPAAPGAPVSGLLEHLPDPATLSRAVRDSSGRTVDMRLEYMNAAARGGQPDGTEPIGRLWSELWPEMLGNGTFAASVRALDTGGAQQGEVEWIDEEQYRPAGYEYRAVRVGDDQLLWMMRDSTERLAQARALSASEGRFRATFEDAPVGMALVSPTGEVTMVNAALAALLEEHPAALEGRRFEELFAPDAERVDVPGFATGRHGESLHQDAALLRSDGERIPAWVSASLVRCFDDRPVDIIVHVKDASAQQRAQAALAHAATHDPLTGLPNRALLLDRIDRALLRRARTGRTCALLWLDLDHFKSVNDSLGHAAGDELLRETSRRLVSVLRETDTVARLGGDEFVALCEDLEPEAAGRVALALTRELSAVVGEPLTVEGHAMTVGATVGVTIAQGDPSASDLLRDADAALYEAKRQGRGRWVVFDERLGSLARARSNTEAGLRRALAAGDFEPYFHPLVDLDTLSLIGVEALARWRQGERVLEPGAFLQVAQETGLIVPISEAIAASASRIVAGWRSALQGTPGSELRLGLNVAPRHVILPGFVERIEALLADSGLPPEAVVLEITEEGLMLGEEPVTRPLERLRARGVRVALDDFGSGFSSLGRLRHLPVDIVKVDRAFLRGDSTEGEDALLRAFVDLSRAFGLTALIEGVEDPATLTAAHRAGYRLAQGHHFSAPLPARAFWQTHLASGSRTPA